VSVTTTRVSRAWHAGKGTTPVGRAFGSKTALLYECAGLVVGVVIWEILGLLKLYDWLPTAHAVFARVAKLFADGKLKTPLLDSLHNLAIGYAVSVVVGVTIGTLMAVSKWVDYTLRVYVSALMATPSILMVPILYVIFGLSSLTLIAVIVLYASVFIVANTRIAVSHADLDLTEMAQAFGAGQVKRFFQVTLRSAGPEIFAGLRLGMGRAVKGMFNGELLIAVTGLAALDSNFNGAFDTTGVLAIAVVVIALAVVLTALLEALNRVANGWAVSKS